MPTADDLTLKRLVLVKQLFQHAVTEAAMDTDLHRILAVSQFDMATETTLRTVVTSLQSSKAQKNDFYGVLQRANDLLVKNGHGELPDKAHISNVHDIRNDVQHRTKSLTDDEVLSSRIYTRDFLQSIIATVWGLSFDAISLAELVAHPEVKEFVLKAESFLQAADHSEAVKFAGAALTYSLGRVRIPIVGRDMSRHMSSLDRRNFFGPGMEMGQAVAASAKKDFETVFGAISQIQNTLLFATLGLDLGTYRRYIQISGGVFFTADGGLHTGGNQDISPANAEFVVAYCTETVMRIQEIVGDLDKPFGVERGFPVL